MRSTFVSQLDRSDCGVASLLSIIRYFGGDANMEELRELSGTSTEGTTLLGLYQAAILKGLTAEGLEGNIDSLKQLKYPCILHVIIDDQLFHYLVCYGFNGKKFIIGDPSSKIIKLSPDELDQIWKSKYLLALRPGEGFGCVKSPMVKKLTWIQEILKKDVPVLWMISILGVIISGLGIVLTIYTQQMIDKTLPSGSYKQLYLGLALVALLLLVRVGLTYIRGHLSNLQNRDFNNRLIKKFYGNLLYLPKQFFNSRKTGELVARLEDTMRIQVVINFLFSELFNEVFLIVVSMGMILYYSPIIGYISLLSIPLFILSAMMSTDKIERYQYDVMNANAVKTGNYINTIQGIDTIKIYQRESHFSLLNEMVYGVFQHKLLSLGRISINVQFLTDSISVGSLVTVIVISSVKVFLHALTIGEFAAIVSISGGLFTSIGNVSYANIRIQGAKVAFNRMVEFAGINPESSDCTSETCNSDWRFETLTLQDVAFRFPGRKLLLSAVNVKIRKGDIIVLTGECGCGKTTLINILSRFYSPVMGIIRVNEQPLEEISLKQWRKIVGVISQETSLYNGTLLYNICMDNTPDQLENALSLCTSLGFDRYFSAFPQGYSTMLGENGSGISGGQKQLVGIARALYKNPQLLLLDEPTSSMDNQTELFVINLIRRIRNQTTIFIITHRVSLINLADTVYSMQNGTTGMVHTIHPDGMLQ